MARSVAADGRTAIQAFTDAVKGLYRFLERCEEGDDPAEAFVKEAKKVLRKKNVRKVRGLPPRPSAKKKPRARHIPAHSDRPGKEPATIDVEGYEVT